MDRTRALILKKDCIEWESGDIKGSEFEKLQGSDIVDFKHGASWIVWYEFAVGKRYSLAIKGENSELRIQFTSMFGMHKEYFQVYSDIVEDIWKFYYSDVVNRHANTLEQDGEITLGGIKLNVDGIELNDGRLLAWNECAIKEYNEYFAIYDKCNPLRYHTARYNEYGTEALWSVARRRCNR